MLIVSRKKVKLARVFMWGGIAVVVVGAVMAYIESTGMECVAIIAAGMIISMLGSVYMNRLFRCPHCKKSVLLGDMKMDLRSTDCPKNCPTCGASVQMED